MTHSCSSNAPQIVSAPQPHVFAHIDCPQILGDDSHFREAFTKAPIGMSVVTPSGQWVEANATMCQIVGYTADELYQLTFQDLTYPDDLALDLAYVEQIIAGDISAYQMEKRYFHKDGHVVWVLLSVTLVRYPDGTPRYFMSQVQDMTPLKQAEQALQHERALLEQRVAERTAELRLANDELARVARLKDEFLAGMSHELRTPLNAILGRGELLRDEFYGPLNSRQQAAIATIEESGRHLLALISDILDLAKMRSGQIEIEHDTVDVTSLCASAVRMIAQTAVLKHIAVQQQIDPAVEYVQGDARRLKQILINLLANAAKFTDEHGQIGIAVQGDIEREAVSFVVWDTGIGIAPEDLSRLFQPFVQLDGRLSRQYNGTGLGLALARQIAEAHGGTIAVESTVGLGSRFRVTLPWRVRSTATHVHAAGLPAIAQARPTVELVHGPLFGTPVLVAEDNEENSTMVCDYLHSLGFRVQLAQNGAEAVVRAIELRPAIILMDIQLPEVDGLEAIRRIRAEPALAGTPIIALTALAMPGDRERCLEAGADAYASKPLRLSALYTLIQAQIERARGPATAPSSSTVG